eukprot:2167262-Prymnesium_polylepis.1
MDFHCSNLRVGTSEGRGAAAGHPCRANAGAGRRADAQDRRLRTHLSARVRTHTAVCLHAPVLRGDCLSTVTPPCVLSLARAFTQKQSQLQRPSAGSRERGVALGWSLYASLSAQALVPGGLAVHVSLSALACPFDLIRTRDLGPGLAAFRLVICVRIIWPSPPVRCGFSFFLFCHAATLESWSFPRALPLVSDMAAKGGRPAL